VSNGGNEKPWHTWKTITEHPKKSLKVALLPLWFKYDLYIIRLCKQGWEYFQNDRMNKGYHISSSLVTIR